MHGKASQPRHAAWVAHNAPQAAALASTGDLQPLRPAMLPPVMTKTALTVGGQQDGSSEGLSPSSLRNPPVRATAPVTPAKESQQQQEGSPRDAIGRSLSVSRDSIQIGDETTVTELLAHVYAPAPPNGLLLMPAESPRNRPAASRRANQQLQNAPSPQLSDSQNDLPLLPYPTTTSSTPPRTGDPPSRSSGSAAALLAAYPPQLPSTAPPGATRRGPPSWDHTQRAQQQVEEREGQPRFQQQGGSGAAVALFAAVPRPLPSATFEASRGSAALGSQRSRSPPTRRPQSQQQQQDPMVLLRDAVTAMLSHPKVYGSVPRLLLDTYQSVVAARCELGTEGRGLVDATVFEALLGETGIVGDLRAARAGEERLSRANASLLQQLEQTRIQLREKASEVAKSDRAQRAAEATEQDLHNKLASMQASYQTLHGDLLKVRTQMARQAQQSQQESASDDQRLNQRTIDLRNDLQRQAEEFKKQEESNKSLERDLAHAKKEFDELERQHAQTLADLDEATASKDRKDDEIVQLSAVAAAKDKRIAGLEALLKDFRLQLGSTLVQQSMIRANPKWRLYRDKVVAARNELLVSLVQPLPPAKPLKAFGEGSDVLPYLRYTGKVRPRCLRRNDLLLLIGLAYNAIIPGQAAGSSSPQSGGNGRAYSRSASVVHTLPEGITAAPGAVPGPLLEKASGSVKGPLGERDPRGSTSDLSTIPALAVANTSTAFAEALKWFLVKRCRDNIQQGMDLAYGLNSAVEAFRSTDPEVKLFHALVTGQAAVSVQQFISTYLQGLFDAFVAEDAKFTAEQRQAQQLHLQPSLFFGPTLSSPGAATSLSLQVQPSQSVGSLALQASGSPLVAPLSLGNGGNSSSGGDAERVAIAPLSGSSASMRRGSVRFVGGRPASANRMGGASADPSLATDSEPIQFFQGPAAMTDEDSISRALPVTRLHRVLDAFFNLPASYAHPTEVEQLQFLLTLDFNTPHIAYRSLFEVDEFGLRTHFFEALYAVLVRNTLGYISDCITMAVSLADPPVSPPAPMLGGEVPPTALLLGPHTASCMVSVSALRDTWMSLDSGRLSDIDVLLRACHVFSANMAGGGGGSGALNAATVAGSAAAASGRTKREGKGGLGAAASASVLKDSSNGAMPASPSGARPPEGAGSPLLLAAALPAALPLNHVVLWMRCSLLTRGGTPMVLSPSAAFALPMGVPKGAPSSSLPAGLLSPTQQGSNNKRSSFVESADSTTGPLGGSLSLGRTGVPDVTTVSNSNSRPLSRTPPALGAASAPRLFDLDAEVACQVSALVGGTSIVIAHSDASPTEGLTLFTATGGDNKAGAAATGNQINKVLLIPQNVFHIGVQSMVKRPSVALPAGFIPPDLHHGTLASGRRSSVAPRPTEK